jgi:8-oxo-dGTP pyrophosphatase MutT (NUDIX family)
MTVRVLTSDPRAWQALELLDAYRPHSTGQSAYAERMFELLATTSWPFAREQFEPGHFTASALVVTPRRDAVLLIHHPTLSLWLQPGGHIDPSDPSPVAAATREVLEETGLAVHIDDALFDVDVHDLPARGAAPAHLHFDLRFLALVDGTPQPRSPESIDARWLSIADAAALTTDTSVQRMLHKLSASG